MQARKPYRLVLIAVAAAILVPAAQAEPAPTVTYGPLDAGTVNAIYKQEQGRRDLNPARFGPLDAWAVNAVASQRLAPDDRSDHGALLSQAHRVAVPAPSQPSGSGFDWGDAGIGAGLTGALMLSLLGSALAVRQTRARRPAL